MQIFQDKILLPNDSKRRKEKVNAQKFYLLSFAHSNKKHLVTSRKGNNPTPYPTLLLA